MIFPTMERLQFDEIAHRYLLDGKPVPSVTKIVSNISEDMMLSAPFIRKTVLGTNVHKVCEKMNNNEKVNISALSEDMRPYVEGYSNFLGSGDYSVICSEMRVFSHRYRYAGTLDILAKNKKDQWCIMDIKTSALVSPTAALQMAAYAQAVEEMGVVDDLGLKVRIKDRVVIWLTGDGKYDLVHFKDGGDWNIFMCKLASHNWDVRNGLK